MPPETEKREIKFVSPNDLLLDARNPRLAGLLSSGALSALSQEAQQAELLRVTWENMAIDELAASIAADGFYEHEPLWVEQSNGKYVVIEGNRRLATVRLLLDEKRRKDLKATDLPPLKGDSLKSLRKLPVWATSRQEAWQAIGFKHVNGSRLWTSYAKAEYIAQLCGPEYRLSLPEIAKSIGDNHKTVIRLHNALTVIRQAEKAKVFHRDDRWKKHFSFSHLYTGLGYTGGIAKFIGLTEESKDLGDSPVPEEKLEELGELLVWIYGSKKADKAPLVQSQNPHIRRLDEALQKREGIEVLRAGRPLEEAVEAAHGDRAVFYKHLIRAKSALERALGKTSGYDGDRELLRTAEAIQQLVDNLVRLMDRNDARREAGETK